MGTREWTQAESAYSAWLSAAREVAGDGAAIVRQIQERFVWPMLAEGHPGTVDLGAKWHRSPGDRGQWQGTLFGQWMKGRAERPIPSLPKDAIVRNGLIEVVTSLVEAVPAASQEWSSFADLVAAFQAERSTSKVRGGAETQRRAERDHRADEALSRVQLLWVAPARARALDHLRLGLGSSVFGGDVPAYVPRTSDSTLIARLVDEDVRLVTVVGAPKAGKSRTVAQLLAAHRPDDLVWWVNPTPDAPTELMRAVRDTKPSELPDVVVIDDAQLLEMGSDGLTHAVLTSLVEYVRVVMIIHASTVAKWRAQLTDRRSVSDGRGLMQVDGVTTDLMELVTSTEVVYESVLDPVELDSARSVYGADGSSIGGLDITRLGECLSAVDQLSSSASAALAAGGMRAAVMRAAVDATHAFPAGVTEEWLSRLTEVHHRLEEPHARFDRADLERALSWATAGVAPRSPHAIIQRTASQHSNLRLMDALVPGLVDARPRFDHLEDLDLPRSAIARIGVAAVEAGDVATARRWWLRAVDLGSAGAMACMGASYRDEGDETTALEWWVRSSEAGEPYAMVNLGADLFERGLPKQARPWWLRAAEEGQPVAMNNMGALHYDAGELDEAIRWFTRAVESGHDEAMNHIATCYADRDLHDEARRWWMRSAEAGNDDALLYLGESLVNEGLVEQGHAWWIRAAAAGNASGMNTLAIDLDERGRRDEARAWWTKAVEAGHTKSIGNIGTSYAAEGDEDQAWVWWMRGVEAGDSGSMFNLGQAHDRRGEIDDARHWWLRAAEAGDTRGMFKTGKHLNAEGSIEEADVWWWRAAKAGHSNAMTAIGLRLDDDGRTEEACVWWKRAADAGDLGAMCNLGVTLYDVGLVEGGLEWLRQAADLGLAEAMVNLGLLLEGEGALPEAREWWLRAVENGSDEAQFHLERLEST